MKKLIVLMAAICFVTMAATTKLSTKNASVNITTTLVNEKYKACIDACNACVVL
jgi:hypothetical protein